MIKKFDIFLETINIKDIDISLENKNDEILNLIKNKFNIIIKKLKERNVRLTSIGGFIHDKSYKTYKTKIVLTFNNKDVIVGTLTKDNIKVEINDEIYFDIDYEEFNEKNLIDKMYEEYKKFMNKKNYKVL